MSNGMYFGVGGKAHKVSKVYLGVGGKARTVKKVYIGDTNGKARLAWTAGVMLGDLPVSKTIQLNEAGVPTNYIVAHQGLPSSLYDASCDGTWLLRQDIFDDLQWNEAGGNSYASSTIKNYLDSSFYDRFDPSIKSMIKQVKIPYRPGSSASETINSGANGLSCKIFLLSGYEVGFSKNENSYFPADGAKLDWFRSGESSLSNKRRITYRDNSATAASWWLRSPHTSSTYESWIVQRSGERDWAGCTRSYGVRPALILPRTAII